MTIRCFCTGAAVLLFWVSGNLHAADTLHTAPATESKQTADTLQRSREKKKQEAVSLKLAGKKKKQEDDSLKLVRKKEKHHADSLKLVANEKEKQEADSLKRIAREKKKQHADSLKLLRGLKSQRPTDTLQRSSRHGKDLRITDTLSLHPPVFPCVAIPAVSVGAFRYSFAGALHYGNDASMVTGSDGQEVIRRLSNNQAVDPGTAELVTGNLDITFGVHRLIDLSVALPYYYDISGWGPSKQTIGDLSIAGTFVPVGPSHAFRLGARLSVITPTGNQEEGVFARHVYYIQTNPATAFDQGVTFARNKVYLHPLMVASFDLQKIASWLPLEMHFNAGGIFSESKERFAIDGAIALALRPVRPLALSLEFASETRPFIPGRSIIDGFLADPLRCLPALAINLPGGITLRLSGEIGLSSSKGRLRMNWHREGYVYATKATPLYGIAFSIIFRGTVPRPAITAGGAAAAGFSADAVSGGDRDRDGISDSIDKCPGTPEEVDGFEDRDGCPDYDNDNDGIADEVDGCPNTPEDVDRFEDRDGCPDADNDNDAISDSLDACPYEKGPEHNRGCPETGDLAFERTVLASVSFEPGTSRIVSGTEMLDRIFTAMQKTPASKIEFHVHTDNRGSADSCRILSQNRADVLKLYLVAKGIRPDRIKAIGLGSEFPVADNSTEAGRAKNQRIEVRRIE